jgi:hypothetical protein
MQCKCWCKELSTILKHSCKFRVDFVTIAQTRHVSTPSHIVETNISRDYTVYNGTNIEHSHRNNVTNFAVRLISLEHLIISHISSFNLSLKTTQLFLGMY